MKERKSMGPLPFMKTREDALAVAQSRGDSFFIDAFMIECWLGAIIEETVAEYADHKNANRRTLQNGRAKRLFAEHFQELSPEDTFHVFESFNRYAEYDDCQSRQVFMALGWLAAEFPDGDRPQPALDWESMRQGIAWARTALSRICDWLEADIHAATHLMAQVNPIAFDPDPERRELAILGLNQRRFPEFSDFERQWQGLRMKRADNFSAEVWVEHGFESFLGESRC